MLKSHIGALFFFVFSALYFAYSFSIHLLPGMHYEAMTARTFPFYLGLLGMGVSAFILLFAFIKPDNEDTFDWKALKTYDFKKGLYFVVAMLFYGYTIRTLGFIISTIIFLIIGFRILEEKSWKVILLTSFSVSIIFWILLTQVLGVYIEQGLVFEYFLGAQS
jgi:putative tricarboxylic transport membrane protein